MGINLTPKLLMTHFDLLLLEKNLGMELFSKTLLMELKLEMCTLFSLRTTLSIML